MRENPWLQLQGGNTSRRVWPTCGSCSASGSKRQAVRSDADHVKVQTEMLQLRLLEKKHRTRADIDELIDGICGVTLTHLSGMSALQSRHAGLDAVLDRGSLSCQGGGTSRRSTNNERPR